jgi:hypothetical protein
MNYASETPVQTTFVARFNLAMLMAWGLWLVLLIAYVLPWVLHSTSSMTLNAYDLAEWTTLSPAQRQVSPALPVALGLRLQLPILVALGVVLLRASRQGFFCCWLGDIGCTRPISAVRVHWAMARCELSATSHVGRCYIDGERFALVGVWW